MSMIEIQNLSFAYEGSFDAIFDNVSLRIDTDWKLGLSGRNGRGKTTLLRILIGELPYQGSIRSAVRFCYFPFSIRDPSLSAGTVIAELSKDAPAWAILRELNRLDLTEAVLEQPYASLSNGEQTKLQLAALFAQESVGFHLIDEPTNHLDAEGRALVANYLNGKQGFILVSHDRRFLDLCVDHMLSINRANIEIQKGNFSSWYENKRRQDDFERKQNARLEKDIDRLNSAARQSREWADRVEADKIGFHGDPSNRFKNSRSYLGEKSRRMQQRRKNLERRQQAAIEEKSSLLKNVEYEESLKLTPLRHPAELLIEGRNLALQYGERRIFSGLDLVVRQGERVALTGRNGTGKSSLLSAIAGENVPLTGSLRLASGLIVSYVPQDSSFLCGRAEAYAKACGVDVTLFLTILRKLDLPRVQFEKDMRDYSAGQRKKVLLARSLCERAHLYLWDEPLNYIDVLSRICVEELILRYRPTLLFVEHDAAFVERTAVRRIEL